MMVSSAWVTGKNKADTYARAGNCLSEPYLNFLGLKPWLRALEKSISLAKFLIGYNPSSSSLCLVFGLALLLPRGLPFSRWAWAAWEENRGLSWESREISESAQLSYVDWTSRDQYWRGQGKYSRFMHLLFAFVVKRTSHSDYIWA